MFTCHEYDYKSKAGCLTATNTVYKKVRQDVYLPRFSSPLSISYTENRQKRMKEGVSIVFEIKNRAADPYSLYSDPNPLDQAPGRLPYLK
jgi:hypothetical protein